MEFGDDSKILNHYSGGVFRQFPKRGRQMKRVRKLCLRWSLRTFFQTELVWIEWTEMEMDMRTLCLTMKLFRHE